jgi:hypothetical protein
VFDLGISGDGTLESPWILRVGYAATSQLADVPDVAETAPSNGQVLAWNSSLQQWVPSAPATTAAGLINHDGSMTGDGSTGSPLAVKPNTARYLSVTTSGVGVSDAGVNALVRVFPDAATRAAASPVPTTNTISLLNSNPGQIDYWNGATWQPITNGIGVDIQPGQFMSLSGAYNGGPVTHYIDQFSTTTDGSGLFEVIAAADLSGYAGVLWVSVTPRGTTPWMAMVHADTNRVTANAYRIDTGAAYAGVAIDGMVSALLY